jgi:hypothetical protein
VQVINFFVTDELESNESGGASPVNAASAMPFQVMRVKVDITYVKK